MTNQISPATCGDQASPARPFSADDCRHNLRWYLIFRATYEFGLWYPIWVLYLTQELELSFTRIMVLELSYQFSMVLLEIPTGMLADTFGRRWSLFCSAATLLLAIALLAAATNAWWVLASFVIWAMTTTLLNGADAAFLYESLLAVGREGEFPKVLGRFSSLAMVGAVVASTIGGWLASWGGYRLPMYVHIVLFPLALVAAFRFREPPRAEGLVAGGLREIVRAMHSLVRRSRRFKVLLAYSAFMNSVILIAIVYLQPFLLVNGLAVTHIGWFFAASMLVGATGPILGTWSRVRFGLAPTLGVAAFSVSLFCLGMFALPGLWVMLPLVGIQVVGSGVHPVVVEGLNRMAGAQGRATVLSLRGIVVAALAGPLEVVSGWYADRVPLRRLFLVCATALPLAAVVLGVLWRAGTGRGDSTQSDGRDDACR